MPYNFPWECPFCGRATTITDPNVEISMVNIGISKSKNSSIGFTYKAIACPNQKCKELAFSLDYHTTRFSGDCGDYIKDKTLKIWNLLPESFAKPQPEYIPEPIKDDYYESCVIKDLSPKASASLARRCLQGMIRDFWKIEGKPTLAQEIDAIQEKVDSDLWKAIDGVRKLGNIGAHMEKDVNLIIDIDPGEAEQLIKLIELLLKEWYVAKHDRGERISRVIKISDDKTGQKELNKGTEKEKK